LRALSYRTGAVLHRAVSSKRLDSVTDYIRNGCRMRVRCGACGHQIEIDPHRVLSQCASRGTSPRLCQVGQRLRCSRCRQRSASIAPGTSI